RASRQGRSDSGTKRNENPPHEASGDQSSYSRRTLSPRAAAGLPSMANTGAGRARWAASRSAALRGWVSASRPSTARRRVIRGERAASEAGGGSRSLRHSKFDRRTPHASSGSEPVGISSTLANADQGRSGSQSATRMILSFQETTGRTTPG